MNAEIDKPGIKQDNAFEQLIAVVETGRDEDVQEAVAPLHPADVAELINLLERSETKNKVFRVLAPDVAPRVLSLLSPVGREKIVQDLSDDRLQQILEELDSDDAADLLGSIPKERAQSILAGLPGPLSARIQQLLRYPADTAGGLMQSEYAAVFEGASLEEAVEIVRTLAEAVSNIHNVFVVDQRFHLLGVLPLSRLILARAGETVDAVMDRQVISVTVDTDQEAVAQLFRKYDLLSLPVTDPRGALLGRITVDDVVDVLEEEANEDFSKLSGLGQEEPIFDSPMRTIRRRLPWLGLNLVTTSLSASVIGLFQGTIETIAVAAALMTIVAAQGGNAGVQTLTVMVRGLALGQITLASRPGDSAEGACGRLWQWHGIGTGRGRLGLPVAPKPASVRRAGTGAAGQLSGGGSGRESHPAHPALAARGSGGGLQRLRHGLHGSLRVLFVPGAPLNWSPLFRLTFRPGLTLVRERTDRFVFRAADHEYLVHPDAARRARGPVWSSRTTSSPHR